MTLLKDKLRLQGFMSIIAIIVGCALLIAGFSVPPLGMIDNSVLIAFGEIATFAGSLVGIDYNYKIKSLRNKDGDKTDC